MLINVPYNRSDVAAYAAKWALKRNPKYANFNKYGGDCTNFASQCIYAGAKVMNYTPTFGWYYNSVNDRTPSWSGVPFLYNFLVNNKGTGPYAKVVDISEMMVGDLIQLGNANNEFFHSLIVTEITGSVPSMQNILISTHTYDSYLRPLNSYNITKARFLHIDGVRKWV